MSVNEVYEYTFNWTIENFSRCFKTNGEFILSPTFSPNRFDGSKFLLKLYPRGKREDVKEYMSLFLSIIEDEINEKEISVNVKWELMVQDTQVLCTKKCTNMYYNNTKTLGYSKFFLLKNIEEEIEECGVDKLTIRCHISRSKPKIFNAFTIFTVDQYYFRWKMLKPNSSNWLESKKISIQESLQFQIDITAPEDDFLIEIKLVTDCSLSLLMKCTLSLLNTLGHVTESKVGEYLYNSSSSATSWQFPSFISISELEAGKNDILKDEAFTLDWEFSYSKDVNSYSDHPASTLRDDLGKMLENEKYCDVRLQCEDVILSAHKSILSSRSPVFNAMFDQNMVENKSGIVDIVDCDSSTLKVFLEYLYNDTLKVSDSETVLKLLLVAEKYQVLTLKERCCSFLISNLTDENVCEVLSTADMIGHKHLKSTASNYIRTNPRKIFSLSRKRKWVESNPDLVTEIICDFQEK